MKKNTNTSLEALLAPTTEVSLRTSERDAMKAELLAYTVLHQPDSPHIRHTATKQRVWRWASAVAVVMLVVSSTGALAGQSLPGQALYGIKVSVLEPLVIPFQYPNATSYERSNVLLQRRLDEVKLLQTESTITSQAVADVHEVIETYAVSVTEVLETDFTSEASTTAPTLSDIDETFAYFDAYDQLLSPNATNTVTDNIVTTLDTAYSDYVDQLIEDGATTTLTTYIDEGISDLIEANTDHTRLLTASSSEVIQDVLEGVSRALEVDSLSDAHAEVSNALQQVLVDEYVETEIKVDEVEGL